jgi:transposase
MASKRKRRFTEEFKREAVALWETSGRLQTEVAGELGIMPTMLRRWQRKLQESSTLSASPAAKPPVSTMASPADQASEIARLRRELDRARMERDILKNVWPAPSARVILNGMLVCINVSGLKADALAKMGSARTGPHKAGGVEHHIFNQAAGTPVRPLCHLSSPPQTS